jgi:hypothetical protein
LALLCVWAGGAEVELGSVWEAGGVFVLWRLIVSGMWEGVWGGVFIVYEMSIRGLLSWEFEGGCGWLLKDS